MKIQRIIPLMIAIELLFQVVLYAEEELPKDKPGTAVFVMSIENKESVTVTGKIIKEQNNDLLIDMKIPIINNLTNKFFQNKLNKEIMKEQLVLKSEIEKDAKRNHQYQKNKGYPTIPYELMTNYHVKSNNGIFSLEIIVYDYRGGAHGMTTTTHYNIDTKKNKQINLKDYFVSGSDYKTIINEEIRKQIREREKTGEVFFEGELGFSGIKDNQDFYINENQELVIVFGLYEIAPYVAGIIEFVIPNEIIRDITKATSVAYVK